MPARIKLYADVDGTLAVPPYGLHESAQVVVRGYQLTIHWNAEVVSRLAALSHLPGTEWWWLIAWGTDAVRVLDLLWGIESASVVDSTEQVGDWSHRSKQAAVAEDQKLDRTPFVWMDDLAIDNLDAELKLLRRDSLLVPVNGNVGVKITDVERIETFIEQWA